MNLDNPKIRELITLASDNGHVVKILSNSALINFKFDGPLVLYYVMFFELLSGEVYFTAYSFDKPDSVITEDEFRTLISEIVLPGVKNGG